MPRVAVYECPCCARRMNVPVADDARPSARVACGGWCRRCEGQCRGASHRLAIERVDPAETPPPAEGWDRRLRRPGRTLDLPVRDPWDLRMGA